MGKSTDVVGHKVSVATTQLCHDNVKAAIDNIEMTGVGIPVKLHLRTPRFKFHVIFLCHEIVLF